MVDFLWDAATAESSDTSNVPEFMMTLSQQTSATDGDSSTVTAHVAMITDSPTPIGM